MNGKKKKILAGAVGGAAILTVYFAVIGWQTNWGPFRFLYKGYGGEVAAIEKRYDAAAHQHEVIFYGASNFRLWTEMEKDLSEYKVQNHGFGGSTDKMLVEYADRILIPYQPDIVFFQTGSNDYVTLSGTDEEKVAVCMEYKRQMFGGFHEQLPDSKFVVMSGLLLPGRREYTQLTQMVNQELERLCAETDYLWFVDASDLTWDGKDYANDLFEEDGIHLNHKGQLAWRDGYILPQLEALTAEFELDHLRK